MKPLRSFMEEMNALPEEKRADKAEEAMDFYTDKYMEQFLYGAHPADLPFVINVMRTTLYIMEHQAPEVYNLAVNMLSDSEIAAMNEVLHSDTGTLN